MTKDEKHQMILEASSQVYIVANRVMKTTGFYDKEELLAAGFLALTVAADRFDETRGLKFRSYSEKVVYYHMIDAIRDRGSMGIGGLSGDRHDGKRFQVPTADFSEVIEESAHDDLSGIDLYRILARAMISLKKREKEILYDYVVNEMSLVDMGEKWDLTSGGILRILKLLIPKLHTVIKKDEGLLKCENLG